eukprot:4805299-Prymnesium_polylepis.2
MAAARSPAPCFPAAPPTGRGRVLVKLLRLVVQLVLPAEHERRDHRTEEFPHLDGVEGVGPQLVLLLKDIRRPLRAALPPPRRARRSAARLPTVLIHEPLHLFPARRYERRAPRAQPLRRAGGIRIAVRCGEHLPVGLLLEDGRCRGAIHRRRRVRRRRDRRAVAVGHGAVVRLAHPVAICEAVVMRFARELGLGHEQLRRWRRRVRAGGRPHPWLSCLRARRGSSRHRPLGQLAAFAIASTRRAVRKVELRHGWRRRRRRRRRLEGVQRPRAEHAAPVRVGPSARALAAEPPGVLELLVDWCGRGAREWRERRAVLISIVHRVGLIIISVAHRVTLGRGGRWRYRHGLCGT